MKAKLPQGLIGSEDPSLPAPTDAEKITPSDANYAEESPDPAVRCQRCASFVEPERCLLVAGVVAPMGSCDFFTENSPTTSDIGGEEFEPPLPQVPQQ